MKRLALFSLFACSCQGVPVDTRDWNAFYEHQPTSILVLPPLNETVVVDAASVLNATITHPLSERGYYVFPVQPTLAILEANGIYEGGQLETIEPQKFWEILGADALLYVTLQAWDDHYDFFGTSFEVALDYRLVDAHTGAVIWEQSGREVKNVGSGGSPLSMLLDPLLMPAMDVDTIQKLLLTRQIHATVLLDLPPGPLSKEHARRRGELLARSKP